MPGSRVPSLPPFSLPPFCLLPGRRRVSQRTDAPVPLRRRGPRPLLLHLTLAMLRSTVSHAT